MYFINGRFLAQQTTGVQRFATEITLHLLKTSRSYKVIVPTGTNISIGFPKDQLIEAGPTNPYFWEQFFLPKYLKKLNSPLLLNFTGLGPVFYKNKIITIHDLSFWEHPEWFSSRYYWFYRLLTPVSVRNSQKILTVSECSKNIISKLLNIRKEKIEVIYNAVNSYQKKGYPKSKFILTVGSIDPRKNINRLIKAFHKWDNPDFKLILVGGKQQSFQRSNIQSSEKVILTGYISDTELFEYYERAEIFIYPSLYEGFGIPALEAMSVGTPVIASDIPVLKESCGEAAYYIDPYSEDSIANALDRLSKDDVLKKHLSSKGLENIQKFSWVASSKKINQAVEELLK